MSSSSVAPSSISSTAHTSRAAGDARTRNEAADPTCAKERGENARVHRRRGCVGWGLCRAEQGILQNKHQNKHTHGPRQQHRQRRGQWQQIQLPAALVLHVPPCTAPQQQQYVGPSGLHTMFVRWQAAATERPCTRQQPAVARHSCCSAAPVPAAPVAAPTQHQPQPAQQQRPWLTAAPLCQAAAVDVTALPDRQPMMRRQGLWRQGSRTRHHYHRHCCCCCYCCHDGAPCPSARSAAHTAASHWAQGLAHHAAPVSHDAPHGAVQSC